jgi:hypothetical protein
MWEGRTEDLGRSSDSSGQIWELTGVGPSGHVHDQIEALYYIETSNESIPIGSSSYAGTQITMDLAPGTQKPIIKQQFPAGATVTSSANTKAISYYPFIRDAGLKLARVSWQIYGGFSTSPDWAARVWVSPGVGVFNMVSDQQPTAGIMGATTVIVGSDFSSGEDQVTFEFQWVKVASGTIGNDNTWIGWYNVVIQQVRVDTAGNEILFPAGYPSNTVVASLIINDLLGRMLPLYDGVNALVDTSNNYGIEQLTYQDGTDAGQVLDDLMALLGTHLWEALETNPLTGLWRFNWRPWPVTIRYDATAFDGYNSPISAADVYDQVLVRWKQADGRIRTWSMSQAVPILTAAGFHRTGFIDLSDNVGSANNATQSGQQFLNDHATPANSGTLTISRPILDRYTGRYVYPWEVRPGYLVRIRGVEPQVDMLNLDRDGSSICRIISTEYSDTANSVQCDLDAYPIEQAQQIASLSKRLANRRRR